MRKGCVGIHPPSGQARGLQHFVPFKTMSQENTALKLTLRPHYPLTAPQSSPCVGLVTWYIPWVPSN